jgi:hypothetical protein
MAREVDWRQVGRGTTRNVRFGMVLTLFLVVLPTAVASSSAVHLTVPSRSPVVVRGTGFHASERVTVTVTVAAKSTHRKVVTAGARGNIRAAFPGFSIGYCESYVVRARGNRGSSGVFKVIPECAPSRPAG